MPKIKTSQKDMTLSGIRLYRLCSNKYGLINTFSKASISYSFALQAKVSAKSILANGNAAHRSEEPITSSMQWTPRSLKIAAGVFSAWAATVIGYVIYEWGRPLYTDSGKLIEDEFSHKYSPAIARIARAIDATIGSYQMIKDPTSDKLLPDPVKYPLYQPKYTLVVEHSGVLVNPEWSYKTGWRYKKRPGLDYFLQKVGYPVFELVIYTEDSAMTAVPILNGLGANEKLFAALFREDTRYRNGTHVKDLSCLNRDLKSIIIIDWNDKGFQLQPRNGIHRLKKWDGTDDRLLYDLADFLEMIATSNVDDLRTVLDHYNEEIDPIASFIERQQKIINMKREDPAHGLPKQPKRFI
ncbi:hypothetical protein GJ496_005138 [Pomphorhynchus laevis]|nr:hypothetical protein GJ496_005138 [Pomphorhynchus laevis]